MSDYTPNIAAKDQALAYWKDPNNFPTMPAQPRTRVQQIIDPRTRTEKRAAHRYRGLLGAMAVMALMPTNTGEIYNG